MSKNRNYVNYYKNPLVEEPKEESTPEVEDTIQEEAPIEEPEPIVVETEVTPKKVIEKTFAVVTGAKKVNLRKGPSKDDSIIKAIPEKTAVKVLDKSNKEWYKIEVNNNAGFMMSKYLKEINK